MSTLFDAPMFQAGIAPFVVAALVAALLGRTRVSGLALVAALAATLMLTTGISFTPLSASRKALLLVLLAPAVALAIDVVLAEAPRVLPWLVAAAVGLASVWVFQSVLAQREGAAAWVLGAGVSVFVALLVGLTLRLRGDNIAGSASALGLGLAVGISAVLSASIGNLMNGIALAAGAGALLLWQFITGRATPAGWTLTLSAGTAAALFAAVTFVLAELPWPALPLLLLVPLVAALPLFADRPPRTRIALVAIGCVLAAAPAVLATWLATRTAGAAA
jgi:hypothetical protein